MTAVDGTVLDMTTVVDHGDPRFRWNLVVLGDGYQAHELERYADDVEAFAEALRSTPPFDDYWPVINVHRIDVESTDSGADEPVECGGDGSEVRTYFDATFCSPWGDTRLRWLLTVDADLARDTALTLQPFTHEVLVMVNSTDYGGGGGKVAVCSLDPQALRIAIHELGHSAFGLGDEYGGDDLAPADEPSEPNVTLVSDPATIKWRAHLDDPTPVGNPKCPRYVARAAAPAPGAVGIFEGGQYASCGVYRAAEKCLMRSLDQTFCRICENAIRQVLDEFPLRIDGPITLPTGDPTVPDLEFDELASKIKNSNTVTFTGYLAPTNDPKVVALLDDPWGDQQLDIPRNAIVAQIPGSSRPDGRSVLWVMRTAKLTRRSRATAYEFATAALPASGKPGLPPGGGGWSPPPGKQPP